MVMRKQLSLTIWLFLLSSLALFAACSKPNRVELLHYKKEIMKQRADKDKFFGESPNSPLLPVQRMNFKGLRYFEPDINYKIEARLTPLQSQQSFKIQTSSGRERLYLVTGRMDFTYKGHQMTLMAYQEKDQAADRPNDFFIPFTDMTTGDQTYGAGRYLDIKSIGQGPRPVVLDFNLAFNPYCAYNYNYSCPIPPHENRLAVSIQAGETKFH